MKRQSLPGRKTRLYPFQGASLHPKSLVSQYSRAHKQLFAPRDPGVDRPGREGKVQGVIVKRENSA